MKILVTGGAGYIGSHTCVELLDAGYEVVMWLILRLVMLKRLIRLRRIPELKSTISEPATDTACSMLLRHFLRRADMMFHIRLSLEDPAI